MIYQNKCVKWQIRKSFKRVKSVIEENCMAVYCKLISAYKIALSEVTHTLIFLVKLN